MGEISRGAHASELSVQGEFQFAALEVRSRRDVHLCTNHLKVSVVSGEQPPQKSQVAFIELNLRADVVRKAGDHRSQVQLAREVSSETGNRRVVVDLCPARHSSLLKHVLGEDYQLGRRL